MSKGSLFAKLVKEKELKDEIELSNTTEPNTSENNIVNDRRPQNKPVPSLSELSRRPQNNNLPSTKNTNDGNTANTLPSSAKTNRRPQNNNLPSTKTTSDGKSTNILPSFNKANRRPLNKKSPSTKQKSSRPQDSNKPSRENKVDGLPSTKGSITNIVDGKPSTKPNMDGNTFNKKPSTKLNSNDRHNKSLSRYDNRVNPKIKKKIEIFCAEHGISQREFAETSAVHFIEKWTALVVDGKTAHDDRLMMMEWKTGYNIINLYLAYNLKNKWKYNDDEVAAIYNDADIRLLELGIIQTQFNANFKRINSFEYYRNEIDNYLQQELSESMLNFLLEHYRTKFTESTDRTIDPKLWQK